MKKELVVRSFWIYGRAVSMLKTRFVSLFCAGLLGIIAAGTGNCADYYVSPDGLDSNSGTIGAPFKTIAKARDVVRTVNSGMSANINVYLRGGWYTLSSALSFNSSDSGRNGYNVIYQAYGSERPVISGGRQITGWTLHDSGKNIWKASASGLNTRQLYVNCVRAIRAHKGSGLSGASQTSSGFYTSDTSMQNWGNISDIELVFNGNDGGIDGGTMGLWVEHRIGIASISGNSITMKQPAWTNAFAATPYLDPRIPTDIENAYELLDGQGEWYLNRSQGVVYYIPRSGDNMSTAVVVAPVLETLVSGSSVNNVQFKGITFAHATWLQPSGNYGFTEHQANSQLGTWTYIPANIYFDYSQYLRFERCMFKHLGSMGLHLGSNCKNNVVTGCVFTDISGNNIVLGNNTDPAGSSTRATGNQVTNCYVHDSCVEYHGGVGIIAAYTADTTISHNEIAYVPYSAISCGWGWGQDPSYYMQNNRISYNYAHHIMRMMGDGGCIYTLSAQPSSTINNNWFDNWSQSGSAGGAIYTDEASAYIEIYNNVCSNISGDWYNAWTNTIHDINVHNNWSTTSEIRNDGTNVSITNTVIISGGISNWPSGAQSVANASGIESSYNDIRTMTCACSYGSTPPPPNTPPSITSQPSNATVTAGQTAGFSVGANGSSPLSYQWQKNQSNISGATSASYTTPATALSDSGSKYRCVVTNSYGSATSNEATLTVTAASVNLALNKTAAASSAWTGYPASNGNDGSNNSLWASASGDASPWWQVDLGAAYQIGSVQIVARQDTNEEQPDSQNNFEVRGSNNSDGSGYTVLASLGSTPYPVNGSWSSSVTNTGSYRYLRVAKTDGAHFNFSEFIANGSAPAQDTTPPSAPGTVRDGTGTTDINSTVSTTQLSANWDAATDNESGISGYRYAIGTMAGGINVAGWTTIGNVLTVTKTGLTLASGTTYYFTVKAVNGASPALESGVRNSNGQVVLSTAVADTTPPSAPGTVRDGTGTTDINSTVSTTQLSANWTAATDPESGISGYSYAIGTTAGGAQTLNWTALGNVTTVTRTGLTLAPGATYYFSVKAVSAGGAGPAANSNGQYISNSPAAYWKLNEGSGTQAQDSSGNGVVGTISGASWTTGKSSGGLSFDGANDTMTWTYTAPVNNFSICAWIKATATHGIDTESVSGTGGISGQMYLFWPDNKGADAGAGISMGTNGISVYEHGNGYMPALAVYSGSLGTGWNHVAVVYENKQPKIYLNGALVRTGLTSPKTSVYAPTVMGGGSYGYYPGTADEVRIYDKALTLQEIQGIYNADSADTTPPSAPGTVRDGTGTTDINSTTSRAQLSANWTAAADADSGVSGYSYAIGTTAGATNITNWTVVGNVLTATKAGLSLAVGTTYYFSVKAVNGAGLAGAATNSNGQVVISTAVADTTAPSSPATVRDGPTAGADAGFTYSTTTLYANWTASADAESGIANYQYAIGTTAGGTNITNWVTLGNALTATKTGLTLTVGTTYYFSVKAINGAGLTGSATNSNGQYVATVNTADTTPPSTVAQVNDGNETGEDTDVTYLTDELSANWDSSADAESGVAKYYYAIGTAPGGTNVTNGWKDNGALTEATETGLTLAVGTAYYFSVKAENGVGMQSAVKNSDGQLVQSQDTFGPLISNVSVQGITSTGATVTWETDEPATSRVEYGLTTGYGSLTVEYAGMDTSHSVALSGIQAGTRYHFRAISRDYSGNESASADFTFTTLAAPVTPGESAEINAYPNPHSFAGGSPMKFRVSAAAGWEVSIYTMSGKLVRKITAQTGTTEISWDGANEAGEKVARGIYLYTITRGSDKITGKLAVRR